MKIKFIIPRDLYINEDFAIDLGADIKDVNVNTDRLTVKFFKDDETTEIPISVRYDNDKKIFFEF